MSFFLKLNNFGESTSESFTSKKDEEAKLQFFQGLLHEEEINFFQLLPINTQTTLYEVVADLRSIH